MIDCAVIGDSIAQGVAQYRPECSSLARSGWTSAQWNRRWGSQELNAHSVIISLGSNDSSAVKSELELRAIRAMARSDRVFWILPANNAAMQRLIQQIALDWGDTVLPITQLSPDRVHPTAAGYRQLAKETK
jgi:lysophospholipase L1-like esterase